MKKITALILALCLVCLCLSGCGSTEIRSYSQDGVTNTETRDMSGAYAAYKPETVVATVCGDDISWQELFYWINSEVLTLDSENKSQIQDWTAAYSGSSDGQSYAEYLLSWVTGAVVQYHVMNAKAKELGVTLTDADKETLKSSLTKNITTYCGENATEEDFNKYLQTIYMSRDYYDFVNQVSCLFDNTFTHMFGENGEKCTDADTTQFATDNNYITADHILFSTVDSEGNALTDDQIAEKKKQAQDAADTLQGITDHTKLLAKFKELKDKYTEDTGAANYPNGYCFTSGQMAEEFQNASENLKEYQVSDPVKTQYGYHVILRLPTTPDDEVSYVSENEYRTLRYYAAVNQYNTLVGSWIDETDVQWKDGFDKLDIPALLKK